MSFEEFMEKCHCCWWAMKRNIKNYEIDYLLEKADELGYDKIDLAYRIADIRDKETNNRNKILFHGIVFKRKMDLAKYLKISYVDLKNRMENNPELFIELDELI